MINDLNLSRQGCVQKSPFQGMVTLFQGFFFTGVGEVLPSPVKWPKLLSDPILFTRSYLTNTYISNYFMAIIQCKDKRQS